MAIKSLIHEILGLSKDDLHPAGSLSAFAGTARVLVIFEDSTGELMRRQDEALSIDALRALDVVVVHVGSGVHVSKRPTTLDAADIRSDLGGREVGRFEVVLIDRNGSLVMRSDDPVTIEEIAQTVATLVEGNDPETIGTAGED
jgi:hypothetical protein